MLLFFPAQRLTGDDARVLASFVRRFLSPLSFSRVAKGFFLGPRIHPSLHFGHRNSRPLSLLDLPSIHDQWCRLQCFTVAKRVLD